MASLSRADGTTKVFTESELLSLLNNLASMGTAEAIHDSIAKIRISPSALLLMDLAHPQCRALHSLYQFAYDSSEIFLVRLEHLSTGHQ